MLTDSGTKPIVVVADDDAATRYVIARTLSGDGFTVIEAANGREALDAFSNSDPDVVLMDVEMPEMNGYQACALIRQQPNGLDLPIVMVTGLEDSESINRAYEVGATDFISKPINWSLIGHRLRYILRSAGNFKALVVSEIENRALIAAIPDRIFIVDGDGVILNNVNAKTPATEFAAEELPGDNIACVLPGDLHEKIDRSLASVLSGEENSVLEYRGEWPGDESDWYECRFVRHGSDKCLAIIRNISDRKLSERKIHKLAYYDTLTELPNRPWFKQQLQQLLDTATPAATTVAVFNIDLNRFKRINDTLGLETGDAALLQIATRLSEFAETVSRENHATLSVLGVGPARLGGNEFAFAISGIEDPSKCMSLADQLRTVIAKPLVLDRHEFVVTASIGVATIPQHGASVEVLLKNAESARDEAKRLGNNSQKLYRSSMDSRVPDCLNMENELRRAIENDELSMFYQPKYTTQSLQPDGAEALLRWFHPERGEIRPAEFIPVAEESGLVVDLGIWVANHVCQQIASWEYFGLSPGPIAINLSGQEFGLGSPIRTLSNAIASADISASALELEITETVLMSDIRSVTLALSALREQGFTLAVDDFGTGYSSLRYLQKFPIDVLKIDSSFICDVEKNNDSRAICTAIIALARSLGLKVVGEGVENDWQLEFLKRQACNSVQGFLLSKPLSPNDFADQLKSRLLQGRSTDRVIDLHSRSNVY